ncbi:exodeoxyribonuclease VII large subunit [Sphingopyxis sp. Root1497]|uniref:exodeoxyribonuclease VII large subunit n=1 Tax=Sphingopyxis sp. Root1497 TaxID=1736474 RepID=UPI0007005C24|nr:exodeoxyribonuclease VII large subunit [Sphingopyxis sp. Root1497]KQZ65838.1 exodeoxyribonuclease VII large subunit [Sphingopyxis sp. Root1497]
MAVPFPDPASETDPAARLLAEAAPGDNVPPLSVSQLSAAIKRTVEDGFARVRVRGELSGAKRAASGHFYAALKDDNALIDMVMWKGQAARLAFRPEDGIEVIATGKLTTYPGRSKYQLVVDTLEVAGEGALMLLFEKLKARLGEEGLFDQDSKQPLPRLPRVIGVVTSPTGAVIRDILHRLADRFPMHVIVWPVLVQGDGAAAQVANAIRGFDAIAPGGPVPRPDLVIVARGGGSIEDLWAFNEEVVVRALADCRIPTISAVGHETDTTLADYAADRRAPTPTAAAEMAVPVRAELQELLLQRAGRMIAAANRHQALAGERLTALARHLPRREALYAPQRQRLDDSGDRLDRSQRHRLAVIAERLATRSGALRPSLLARRWDRDRARIEGLGRLLDSLDPRALLSRGYAMVRDTGGAIVTTAAKAEQAGHLWLQFADGEVPVQVAGGDAAPPLPAAAKPARKPSPDAPKRGQGELF